jgi:hypothetical protein
MPTTGFEVPAEQLGHRVDARSGHFRYQARGQAKCEFDQPGRALAGVDRLEAGARIRYRLWIGALRKSRESV